MTKTCGVCKLELPVEKFQVSAIRRKKGHADIWINTCKDCSGKKRKEASRERERALREKLTAKGGASDPNLEVKDKRVAPAASKIQAAPLDDRRYLIIDFVKYPDVLASIRKIADQEEREPERQILYWLKEFSLIRETADAG